MRTLLLSLLWLIGASLAAAEIPVTTSSATARDAYLQARSRLENLRNAQARTDAQRAVDADSTFALGWLAMAQTSTSAGEFFDHLATAARHAGGASEGERLWITGFDAGSKGQPEAQRAAYERLVLLHPDDPRAHNLMGLYHFAQQDWASAVTSFQQSTKLDPDYAPPWNMLGYALRFLGDIEGAESAFRHYIDLIPDDPNPYDSYAELLMKVGRYGDSIAAYRQALQQDPTFQPSVVGIATNLNFLGQHAQARHELLGALPQASNDGQRRGIWFAMAVSHLDEGNTDAAIGAIAVELAIAQRSGDAVAMAGDHTNIGTILLETGDLAAAAEHFAAALPVVEASDREERIREGWRRGDLYNRGRLAAERGAYDEARDLAEELRERGEAIGNAFVVRLAHELTGITELASGNTAAAATALGRASQQNPANLLRQAHAAAAAGDEAAAARWRQAALDYRGLNNLNQAMVRGGILEPPTR
jgi:tetratricopeptide (TPR) repeat protein